MALLSLILSILAGKTACIPADANTADQFGVYINSGWSPDGAGRAPLGPYRAWIEAQGFAGVRTDINWDPDWMDRTIAEFDPRETKLKPIFIIHGNNSEELVAAAWLTATKCRDLNIRGYLEVTNEPNYHDRYWKSNPEILGRATAEVYRIVEAVGADLTIITGGVGNSDTRGLVYLNRMLSALDGRLPVRDPSHPILAGYHSYRPDQNPYRAHLPFASRVIEHQFLKSVARGRPLAMTETGYTSDQAGERKQYERIKAELEFQRTAGNVELAVIYQLRNPPGDKEHFGLIRNTGSLTYGGERVQSLIQSLSR